MCGATDRPIDMHKIDVKCIINDVKEIGVNEELDVMQKSDAIEESDVTAKRRQVSERNIKVLAEICAIVETQCLRILRDIFSRICCVTDMQINKHNGSSKLSHLY